MSGLLRFTSSLGVFRPPSKSSLELFNESFQELVIASMPDPQCSGPSTCDVRQSCVYECDLEGMGEGGVYHYKGNLGSWLNNQRNAKKGQTFSCYFKITLTFLCLSLIS